MRLHLWGDIDCNSSKALVEDILNANEDIDLFICSEGGDFDYGTAIVDAILLREKEIKIRTIGWSKVYSTAAYIFCFGVHRLLNQSSCINLHPFFYSLNEDYTERQNDYTRFSKKIFSTFCGRIDSRLGWSPGNFSKFVKKDRWLTANEAIKKGIAHDVYNI